MMTDFAKFHKLFVDFIQIAVTRPCKCARATQNTFFIIYLLVSVPETVGDELVPELKLAGVVTHVAAHALQRLGVGQLQEAIARHVHDHAALADE